MNKSRLWIAPTLATIILAMLNVGSVFFYNQFQNDMRAKESAIVLKYMPEFIGGILLLLIAFLLYTLSWIQFKLIITNQQLHLKSIILNSLAHDVSTPLTSLNFIIDEISQKNDAVLNEAQKQRAKKNLIILNDMLASVRSLSRLELEKEDLKTQRVPLFDSVTEAITRVQDLAENKQIKFIIKNINNEVCVKADENTLVNNVIPNVLVNAIKFTKPQTNVTIQVEESNGYVCLVVTDEGRGFSKEEIEKFNSGQVIKTTTGTAGEVGSGLGLSQVKGFMELYNGNALLSNSDYGATIKLRFKPVEC